jgi:uncharacterized alkaline shock family protein YloU
MQNDTAVHNDTAVQHDTHAHTQLVPVDLPASLTDPLPEDAAAVTVAARTAAVTALGVDGVHHLGGLAERAADQVRSRLGRSGSALGVRVDDSDGTLDVAVAVVVSYPHPVMAVAAEVRSQVGAALAQLAELPDRVEVDVRVLDVHGPFDDEPSKLDEAVESVRGAASDAADTVSDAAKSAAKSAADTARSAADTTKSVASDALAAASATASDAAASARDAAGHARDAIDDAADAAADAGAEAVDATRRTASDVADRAEDAADSAREAATAAAEQVGDDTADGGTEARHRADVDDTVPESTGSAGSAEPASGAEAAADALEDAADDVRRAAEAVRAGAVDETATDRP